MIIGDLSISPLYVKWESIPGTKRLRSTPDWDDIICASINITASMQELEVMGLKLRDIPDFTAGQPINIDLDLTSKLVDAFEKNKDDFGVKDWQIAKFREVLNRYGIVDVG